MSHRDRVALALALGAHAVVLVAARRCAVVPVPPHVDATDIAIELDESPVTPSGAPAEQNERREILSAPKRALEPTRGANRAARTVPREAPSVTAAPPNGQPPALTHDAPPEPPAGLTLAQLGLEGPNPFITSLASLAPLAPPPPAPPSRDRADGVGRSIAESLLQHDRSVGLGSEGPAIAAIEEVVVASTAAVNGRAVLSLVVDGLGVVTGVACVDGDHAQWDGIAGRIVAALRNRRLRAAPGGRGVELRIEVTSREELPSGRDPGLEVRLFRFIPLKRGRGPRSTRIDLLDIAPKVVVDEPNPDGTVGSPTAAPAASPTARIEALTIFKLEGDPVDLGAKARRVVHAKVLEEHAL